MQHPCLRMLCNLWTWLSGLSKIEHYEKGDRI